MGRIQDSIGVDAPASACYQQWRNFEEFPRFMKNVKRIHPQGDKRWHWVVNGPLGKDMAWDAVLDGDEPNKLISWHSISKPDVGIQGAVRFDEIAPEQTQITVTIQYEAPAGALGELIGTILSNPGKMLADDLQNFKNLMEGRVESTSK